MGTMTVKDYDRLSLDDLYDLYRNAIGLARSTNWAWSVRAANRMFECIDAFEKFLDGEVNTDFVKSKFKLLTVEMGNEVVMTDAETYAVYCLAGVAHAAAHLGHLAVALSRSGEANQEYASVQKGYVMLGLEEAKEFARKVELLQGIEVS